jgi:cytochrome c peroxidase
MKYLVYVFLLIVLVFSCRKDRVGYKATPYVLDIPSHFPDMIIPTDNPMTVEGVDLGRYLFYEKKLSGDNSMSCASCHMPENSFSDPNQYSTGIDGIQGTRQSMALVNMGWENFFFWDGRETTLEKQILDPVINPIEMHETWKNAVAKLNQDMNYRNRFFRAFGEGGIDSVKAAKAIAQFIRTMISGQSKYDVMYKYENGMSLSATEQSIFQTIDPEEWAGYDLFKSLNGADCFHCHNGPLMRVKKFSNNGLLPNFLNDLGRAAVTNNPEDNYKFKVPTLRNIALTAPYMHDGRFSTLDEVIEHYSSGIHMSPTIDPLIEFGSQGGVQLDVQEKYLLKKFLLTLTDENFVNNPKFKDPH